MFICFLAGGLGMSITIGIVDVLFVQAKTQGSVSASADLALGLRLLTFRALVASRCFTVQPTDLPRPATRCGPRTAAGSPLARRKRKLRILGRPQLTSTRAGARTCCHFLAGGRRHTGAGGGAAGTDGW
jgi:hypothetical protein